MDVLVIFVRTIAWLIVAALLVPAPTLVHGLLSGAPGSSGGAPQACGCDTLSGTPCCATEDGLSRSQPCDSPGARLVGACGCGAPGHGGAVLADDLGSPQFVAGPREEGIESSGLRCATGAEEVLEDHREGPEPPRPRQAS